MKIFHTAMLTAIAVYLGGCAKGESYTRANYNFAKIDKVAIVDVIGNIGGEAAKNQISDFWAMELLKRGYTPVERAQIQSLLREQNFQRSGVTAEEDVVKAGRILNVPTVIVVNIPNFGETMSMTAKMLDVEDGSIIWLGSGTGGTYKWGTTALGAIAGAGTGAVIGGQSGEAVAGGAIGGVVGGVAGHLLSPQQAVAAKKLVEKVAEDMPSKIK